LAQQARLSIVPIANDETASGQVTVVEAMRMGRPVIATRCVGTEDYIDSGHTGILVPPSSPDTLANAISQLWNDQPLRARLAHEARRHADLHFSDEAAGQALAQILDELATTSP
jgi:glycosyltransferase involved in cell wall biosynthesis